MTQILFGSDSTPSLPDMDANFTELYGGVQVADGEVAQRWKATTARVRLRPYVDSTYGAILEAVDTAESGNVPLTITASNIRLFTSGAITLLLDSNGNVISKVNTSAPSLTTNGTMVFSLTSNTNLRISVRGSDGTTRVANITLA